MQILNEQILHHLKTEPWLTSHALLQRCTAATRGSQVSDALQTLRRHKVVHCRSTPLGLCWALTDTAKLSGSDVAMLAVYSNPHRKKLNPAPALTGSMRHQILEFLRTQNVPLSTRTVADAMRITADAANYCLRCEEQLGNVTRHCNAKSAHWAIVRRADQAAPGNTEHAMLAEAA